MRSNVKQSAKGFASYSLLLFAAVAFGQEAPAPSTNGKLVVDGPAAGPKSEWQSDQVLLAGLRSRGLFAVAEAYCRARLDEEQLSSRARAELTLELSRTLAAHAVQSPPEARDALWVGASATIDGFLRQQADHPRAFVLRLQDGLVAQGRGELAVREAELLPGDATLRPTAQKFLREAIGRLTVLRDDVAGALRKAPRMQGGAAEDDPLSADALVALERNVRYQIAKAQQQIAETYPAGNDRIDALAQADKLLEPLAAANSEDEVVWQARVDRVAVDRKLGRAEQAEQRIEQMAERARPAWVDARLFVERALLAAAGGNHDAGLKILDAAELAAGGISAAERDDLRLEVVLSAWRAAHAAGDAKTAGERQTVAAELVRRIGAAHGPYWSRRAKLRAAATIAGGAGANDATLLASAAENFLHTGRADEAIRAYDQAAAAARAIGDDDQAFRLALTAAAVEQQQKRLKEALVRYAELARTSPKHPEAAKAHLQATWNAAHAFGAQSSEYRALLDEHIKNWSESPTADDARMWLGRVLESERQWSEAAAAYRSVRAESKQFAAAVNGAVVCYDRLFAVEIMRRQQVRDREVRAEEAAKWAASLVLGVGDNAAETWPKELSATQRVAVLAAARWRLRYAMSSPREVATFLAKAAEHAEGAPVAWRGNLKLLRIEAAAAEGAFDRADAELSAAIESATARENASPVSAAAVRELLAALATQRSMKTEDAAASRRLAALELAAGKLVAAATTSDASVAAADSPAARRAQAEALVAAGRRDEALTVYRKLAAELPGDAAVQRGFAALLSAGGDRASLAAALAQWRLVESKSRVGTAEWFAAKYEIAALHERLGDKQQALRVVTLLAALYPDLGGAEMKGKFEALRKRCQSRE